MEQTGLAMLPVSKGGTPVRENSSELGNAALPVLDSGQGGDAEVEDIEAKLRVGWLGRRRGGTAGEARRNVADLTEATTERNGRR